MIQIEFPFRQELTSLQGTNTQFKGFARLKILGGSGPIYFQQRLAYALVLEKAEVNEYTVMNEIMTNIEHIIILSLVILFYFFRFLIGL